LGQEVKLFQGRELKGFGSEKGKARTFEVFEWFGWNGEGWGSPIIREGKNLTIFVKLVLLL